MKNEHVIVRYRRWYRKLLGLYPRSHRERFAEGMEQTFGDLCRERAERGERLGRFVLGTFVETSAGIVRENVTSIMKQTNIVRLAIVVGLILLIPLWGNHFIEGWNWGLFDFVWAGALLFGTGLAYELLAKKGGAIAYRAAAGVACAAGFLLVWINAAVGIIGDGPVNLMYFGVVALLIGGAFIARFQPHGMSLAFLATALAQLFVPVIALAIWKAGGHDLLIDPNSPHPPFDPGVAPVFALNAVFATLFAGSALLFRRAGDAGGKIPVP